MRKYVLGFQNYITESSQFEDRTGANENKIEVEDVIFDGDNVIISYFRPWDDEDGEAVQFPLPLFNDYVREYAESNNDMDDISHYYERVDEPTDGGFDSRNDFDAIRFIKDLPLEEGYQIAARFVEDQFSSDIIGESSEHEDFEPEIEEATIDGYDLIDFYGGRVPKTISGCREFFDARDIYDNAEQMDIYADAMQKSEE